MKECCKTDGRLLIRDVKRAEAERTEQRDFHFTVKRIGLPKAYSGVVSLYAACIGNERVVSDKEKREERFL